MTQCKLRRAILGGGYLPLELVVRFLLQLALDKHVVRTGVCVYVFDNIDYHPEGGGLQRCSY